MKVAIVGSRTFDDTALVDAIVRRLMERDPDVVIVSGGARGADSLAEAAAKRLCKTAPEIYPAEWGKYGRSAGMLRNRKIVGAADEVVALWDVESRGTLGTIRMAVLAKKPTFVYVAPTRRWMKEREVRSL